MKLIKGEFKEKLDLLFAPSLKAGFPSPAEDYLSETLDFNKDLIKHPEATFYAQIDGDSMTGIGINEGDIAVIDKSLEPQHGDIVVAAIGDEFNIKRLDLISPNSPIQQDLFDMDAEQIQKLKRLDEVVDRINKINGSETIVIGSQQYTKPGGKGRADVFSSAMKQDFKSKNPTTRWSDIIRLK